VLARAAAAVLKESKVRRISSLVFTNSTSPKTLLVILAVVQRGVKLENAEILDEAGFLIYR